MVVAASDPTRGGGDLPPPSPRNSVRPEKRWVASEVDEGLALSLAAGLRIEARWARLLVSRGVRDLEAARRFLEPSLKDLPDPSTMLGLDRAAARLADAIASKERVALYGDYDVDGVTSTVLLASFLRAVGVEARTYIPQRLSEGYGLNPGAVDVLAGEGTKLLVTLDCGITAADEIARANARGIDCVIVDHHRCPAELPPAYAVLNPHQPGCTYPDKGLAAVGVCFNLLAGVRRVLRERGVLSLEAQPNLKRLLDLVALGTVADMVPLMGVNRTLVHFGLEELRLARRPGMRALCDVSGVRPARALSGDIGFKLGPRVNAAGRLADADVGVRLLLSETLEAARPLAERLDAANGARQKLDQDVFAAATAQVEAMGAALPAGIVVYDEAWHPGVVGIVASKLVEAYARPTIVIGQGGRGSARTAKGVHVYDAIARASACLRKFGGHRAAAGLTVDPADVPRFREDFVREVAVDPGLDLLAPELNYDAELAPEEVGHALLSELGRFEPFGNMNPEPMFRVRGARVLGARLVGKNHLKLRIAQGANRSVEAIAWRMGELEAEVRAGSVVELACTVGRNEFSGVESVELVVKDLRARVE